MTTPSATVDASLVAAAVAVPLLLVAANVLFVARYLDPAALRGGGGGLVAAGQALLLVLLLLLCECTVLLLPLDAANRAGVVSLDPLNVASGGLDVAGAWQALAVAVAVCAVCVVPFAIFLGEESDGGGGGARSGGRACCLALLYTGIGVAAAGGAVAVAFRFGRVARLGVDTIASAASDPRQWGPPSAPVVRVCGGGGLCACSSGACPWSLETLAVETSLSVYAAALFTFAGWFVFAVYLGVGLVALPGYLIAVFTERPRLLSTAEARTQRRILGTRAAELIGVGEGLAARVLERRGSGPGATVAAIVPGAWLRRRACKAEERAELARLRVLCDALEADLEALALSDPQEWRRRYNPLVPILFLALGVLSIVLSAAWLAHIAVNVAFSPPLAPVLDGLLAALNSALPPLADFFLAVLALYLLCAAAAGAMALGSRLFLVNAHRLEPGRAPLSALLVLAEALLLCVLPCTQLLARAFRSFIRHSDATVLFGAQFESLDGLRYVYAYNVFIFAVLGISALSVLYFAFRPSQRAHLRGALEAMKARRAREFRAAGRRVERAEAGAGLSTDATPSPPRLGRGRQAERGGAGPAARSSAPAPKAAAAAASAGPPQLARSAEQRRAASVGIELPPWRPGAAPPHLGPRRP